ncbi:MAG: bifunctional phosphopantothenoylcysteine decarboxylase/phosphopantothenate--cysteine ligase CoaBC [Bacteroidota bacterium]
MSLKGKKILLGISGSIAAYKAAFLTRLLVKAGAEVQVLMTEAASAFITPLTLSTLSKKNVYTNVSSGESWNNHVDMGLWADAMLIAPATATTLGKLANGIADNIIVATYLSARCPVFFAPAMDLDMWAHPATQANVDRLQSYGNRLIPVGHGELASGLSGAGRMAEPEDIVGMLASFFREDQPLKGQKILVTAGPTYESLDPVRFIGNRSSGKMGIALAEAAATKGATVELILGPSRLKPKHPRIRLTQVESAQQMYEAASAVFPSVQAAILAAAVADYRPAQVANSKIKKKGDSMQVNLVKTTDIAASLGKIKKKNQLLVGFALETNNEIENAKGKLERKNFDFIVLNSLQDKGAGFNHDTNKITIIHPDNKIRHFELKPKDAVAVDIINELIVRLDTINHQPA